MAGPSYIQDMCLIFHVSCSAGYVLPSCGEYWLSSGYVPDISLYHVVQDMYRVPSCGGY